MRVLGSVFIAALVCLAPPGRADAAVVRTAVRTASPGSAVGRAGALPLGGAASGAVARGLQASGLSASLPSLALPSADIAAGKAVYGPAAKRTVPVAAPGVAASRALRTRAGVSSRLTGKAGSLAPHLEAIASADRTSVEGFRIAGSAVSDILLGRRSAGTGVPAGRGSSFFSGRTPVNGALSALSAPDLLIDPVDVYQRAYDEARRWAQSVGKGEVRVFFGDASGSMPVSGGAHWKLTFYLAEAEPPAAPVEGGEPPAGDGGSMPAAADAVTVEILRGPDAAAGAYETRLDVRHEVALPADQPVFQLPPFQFSRLSRLSPQEAAHRAQRTAPYLGSQLSVSLRLEVSGEEGETRSLWYHFFDPRGNETAVSAWTGEVRELTKPEVKTTEEKKESVRLWKKLRDLDSWMGENIPLYETAKWLALIGAALWLLDMAVGFADDLPRLFGL